MFCDLFDLKLSAYSLRTYPVFWILEYSLNISLRNWNLSHSFTSEMANTHKYKQNDSWCWQFHFVHNINILYNSTGFTLRRIVVCCNKFLPVSGVCSEQSAIWQNITSSRLNWVLENDPVGSKILKRNVCVSDSEIKAEKNNLIMKCSRWVQMFRWNWELSALSARYGLIDEKVAKINTEI